MLSVVIQAGGRSSRMGQDKALMPFLGEPLVRRVLRRLRPLADELLITTNNPQDYPPLGVRLVPDVIPDRGALGGLLTALSAARFPLVAVVACDLPFVSPAVLAAARDRLLTDPSLDAVIPRTDRGLEPLCAVYRRESCLPPIRAAIAADRWRAIAWHDEARIGTLEGADLQPLDPQGLAFFNVNTPDEFRRAEELAQKMA